MLKLHWEDTEYMPLKTKEWEYITSLMKQYEGKPDQEMLVLRALKIYTEKTKKVTYYKFLRFLKKGK